MPNIIVETASVSAQEKYEVPENESAHKAPLTPANEADDHYVLSPAAGAAAKGTLDFF